jgi:hypothetical protein
VVDQRTALPFLATRAMRYRATEMSTVVIVTNPRTEPVNSTGEAPRKNTADRNVGL